MIEKLDKKVNIEDMIYEIRGKQVMLDSDLASLYHCKNGTKEINQAVKNNINKFPERFSWKLTDAESKLFLVKNFDQKKETRGGKFKNPRVFTEQGVAMLATILKSKIATNVSIDIMDAFVAMRHYIGNNEHRLFNVETKVIEHDLEIKLLQESFDKLEEKRKINEIYFNGQIYDAYSKILEIFKSTKKELIIIDSYADNTILDIIKRLEVKVLLITKSNNLLTKQDIEKYNKQYHNLTVIFNNDFHDRYFIIDKKDIYHCGTSINRIGYKTFSITLINDIDICKLLINKVNKIIKRTF
jgi:hypothetical protein